MNYIQSLNEPQREAVLHIEGPLMIIAGAGSGKTRVLTLRIAHLMEQGVEPFNILSLTFTNKAAREMQERISKIVGPEAKNLWMGTFHSIFAKILRFEAERLGYTSNFTIYDSDDSKSLISSILKDMKLDDKLYKPNAVLGRISSAKNNLISWRAYQANPDFKLEDETSGKPKIGEIYQEYCTRCFRANAMDFDDLLFNTNVLFHAHLDVLNKYQHKFKYILIDEFQDTNLAQYFITKRLSSVHHNICVVGDDAQSIYAFRGANIQNILNFEKDYPTLHTVKLEQNYRSTQNIVGVANSLIKHNRNQLRKSVWTDNEAGNKITLLRTASDMEEGRLVATSIFEEKVQHSLSNNDFAVLYRTNAQSRSIEESLRKLNIKYKIIGGLSFYQRKEVKDLIAYLRFVVNPSDEEAFKRIINLPKRGIGDSTVDKIRVAAAENGISIWEVVCDAERYLGKGRNIAPIDGFATLIKASQLSVKAQNAFEAASYIAKHSGILKELYDDKTVEGRVRYENVQELLNAIKGFVDSQETEDKSMPSFLQQVALVSTADTETDEEAVTLMTIHMSKGLEFKYVYIVGMEENLFPSQMMLGSREDLEEERRLFYVAITRAEKKLCLSYALQRYKFGSLVPCEPSRFLKELDPSFLESSSKFASSFDRSGPQGFDFGNAPSGFSGFSGFKKAENPGLKKAEPAKPSGFSKQPEPPARNESGFKSAPATPTGEANFGGEYKPCDPDKVVEGMRVAHSKFGLGTVTGIDDQGSSRKARITFDKFGEKTLILSFAKLLSKS